MDMGPSINENASFGKGMVAFSLEILLSQIHIVDHTIFSSVAMRFSSQTRS
jgi:hypothetical protein